MPDAAPERTSGTSSGQAPARAAARAPGRTPEPKSPGPSTEDLRRVAPNVIDQRQQQIDPAGHHRRDPNRRAGASQKQPGGKSGSDVSDTPPKGEAADDPPEPG